MVSPVTITYRIIDNHAFDVKAFSARWQRARKAAILAAIPEDERVSFELLNEIELLKILPESLYSTILRNVFDNSQKLGKSVVLYLGLRWEITDLIDVLPKMESPCFLGEWIKYKQAYVLERKGCTNVCVDDCTAKKMICEYWREAFDGLVMGACEDERLARHRSVGHGDTSCLDILYIEKLNQPVLSLVKPYSVYKYGGLPENLKVICDELAAQWLMIHGVNLVIEGYSEKTLYYHIVVKSEKSCSFSTKPLVASLEEKLKNIEPILLLQDTSPIAVYGGAD